MNKWAKIGAVCYVVWGLLHINAARLVYALGQSVDPGMVQARLFQNAWHLLFFAIACIVIAIAYNWNNSRMGYWLNLIMLSVVDVGFIVLVLVPGYLPLPAYIGPVFWVLAAVFTTIGLFGGKQELQSAQA